MPDSCRILGTTFIKTGSHYQCQTCQAHSSQDTMVDHAVTCVGTAKKMTQPTKRVSSSRYI